jgi:hypothetical protein
MPRTFETRDEEQGCQFGRMTEEEVREWLVADVDGEEFAEEGRAGGEDTQGPSAKARVAIKEEQERGHALREGEDGGVAGFVEGEAAGLVMAGVRVLGGGLAARAAVKGVGEEEGLAEGEGEAFAGDGVDGAGGVADEGDVAAGDVAEAAGEGEGAAFGGGGWCAGEFVAEEGDGVEDCREAEVRVTRHDGDADFFGSDGGDVGLAEGTPVDFDVSGPGGDAVVGAEAEAAAAEMGGVESSPGADAGGGAVGADEPLAGEGFAGEGGGLVWLEDDGGVPGEADAQFFGAVEKEGVEGGAADADAGAIGEVSGDAGLIGGEGDAGEFGTAAGVDLDAELGESGAGVRHESFAAGFVDGRAAGVGEEDVGSALAEGDGGGEARGSGSGDEDVTVIVTHVSPVRQ